VHTFPPSTSSPIIRQAAVCIVLDFLSPGADDVMAAILVELDKAATAELCA
jgi:hypothetical protein